MGCLFDNNEFFFAAIDASLVLLLTGAGGAAAMNTDFSSPLPSDNTDEPVVLDVLLFFLISPRSDGITSGQGGAMVTYNVSSSYTRTATNWGGSGRVVEAEVVAVLQPIPLQVQPYSMTGVDVDVT